MLTKLYFENFKSWRSAKVDCAPITGFFGTNSSGKTSIIQFLLMLKQTKDASDRAISIQLNGDLALLGTFRDILHRHETQNELKWEIGFKLDQDLSVLDPSKKATAVISKSRDLSVSTVNANSNGAPRSTRLEYNLGETSFSLSEKENQGGHFDLVFKTSAGLNNDFQFTRTQGRAWKLPGPVKSYSFPDQARTYFQNAAFLADLEKCYEDQLDKIFYLGPLRQHPKREYLWARSRPSDVGQQGELAIAAILSATESGEKRNIRKGTTLRSFQEIVAYWLKHMGLIEEFKVVEIAENSNLWQAKVKTRKGAEEVLLTDVGFGISQVLPVVTLLQYVPEGSTVVLEQPEIHLHPLAQAGLADVIIQAAVHRKVQVILESHSEHLLLRLQRKIAEDTLANSDVKLYFCDAPLGESILTPLKVDLLGNIENWPKNFMGDAFGETAAAEIARLTRLKRSLVNQ